MFEGVDLDICLLFPRGVDLTLTCLNCVPVSVHVNSVVHLSGCTLSMYGTKYPVYWALMMNIIQINCFFLYISSPYINPNMNRTPIPEPQSFRGHPAPSFNRSSICKRPDSHMCFFFPFVYLEISLFPSVCFVPLPFSLCMESTSYVFPFRMLLFYLGTTDWIILHQFM